MLPPVVSRCFARLNIQTFCLDPPDSFIEVLIKFESILASHCVLEAAFVVTYQGKKRAHGYFKSERAKEAKLFIVPREEVLLPPGGQILITFGFEGTL